jgi:hypothetical protein
LLSWALPPFPGPAPVFFLIRGMRGRANHFSGGLIHDPHYY